MSPAGVEADVFSESRQQFEQILGFLDSESAGELEHSQLEEQLDMQGRALLRQLFQDHLDLRTAREPRLPQVIDVAGVPRPAVEPGHQRRLSTVFGPVRVCRMAYRARGHQNLHPADAVLNLPAEQHSHGLRRMAAEAAVTGSFDAATAAIRDRTAGRCGKRQVEQLLARAAVDVEQFYRSRPRQPVADSDVLVISADGKGIVMRPGALRPATRSAAANSGTKLASRLSRGEKRNRKRMAEVGAVYDLTPAWRGIDDILTDGQQRRPAPTAKNKWLTVSVDQDAAAVLATVFDEAERRDPTHRRTWVALVDGNNHQISRIRAEARARGIKITILVDFVHVLEYLWKAAWCFHPEGDPAAETWVSQKAHAVLAGQASLVAAAIRRKATMTTLPDEQRRNADRTADYLLNKRCYLDYPTALASGWPIATGIIEGACRHLVKDRMDITGARWGLPGAEAVLKLRALKANGDFADYWTHHLTQEQHRTHRSNYADATIPTAA
jgi:hypothetical protein